MSSPPGVTIETAISQFTLGDVPVKQETPATQERIAASLRSLQEALHIGYVDAEPKKGLSNEKNPTTKRSS